MKKTIGKVIASFCVLALVLVNSSELFIHTSASETQNAPTMEINPNETIPTQLSNFVPINDFMITDLLFDEILNTDTPITDMLPDDPIIANDSEEAPVEEVDESEYVEYQVQSGDSMWLIADKHYGSGTYCNTLAQVNNMEVTDMIHPGDILLLPEELDDISYSEPKVVAVSYSEPEPVNTETIASTPKNPSISSIYPGENVDVSQYIYAGEYRITGYDPHCAHCCGKTNGITASGREAVVDFSIGISDDIPFGTIVYIDGYGYYRVDDRGRIGTNHIDIARENHDACYQVTNWNVDVWFVPEGAVDF